VEEVRASSSPIGTDVGSKTGWLRVDPAYLVLALLPWLVFEARTLGAGTIDSGGISNRRVGFLQVSERWLACHNEQREIQLFRPICAVYYRQNWLLSVRSAVRSPE
jgi:hypothetical protein